MHRRLIAFRILVPLAGSLALAAAPTWGADLYKAQVIARAGDRLGDLQIKPGGSFQVGTLTDASRLTFVADSGTVDGSQILFLAADGSLTSLVAAGREAPGGRWSDGVAIRSPVSMNAQGDMVLLADITTAGRTAVGTFLREQGTGKITPLVLKGMPAPGNRVFETAGDLHPALINSRGEIAFGAGVKNANGQTQLGAFLRAPDGAITPLAVPDQALPGGGSVVRAAPVSLGEDGRVAFWARQPDNYGGSAFLAEKGTITPLLLGGVFAPAGSRVVSASPFLNNRDHGVVVSAVLDDRETGPTLLYRVAEGRTTQVLAPGQEMPEGGKFGRLQLGGVADAGPISPANSLGQHAFLAYLEDGSTAAYRLDPDNTLSLLVKSGATTDVGKITRVGSDSFTGISLNSKGQVALVVRIDDSSDALVLLTPNSAQ